MCFCLDWPVYFLLSFKLKMFQSVSNIRVLINSIRMIMIQIRKFFLPRLYTHILLLSIFKFVSKVYICSTVWCWFSVCWWKDRVFALLSYSGGMFAFGAVCLQARLWLWTALYVFISSGGLRKDVARSSHYFF